MNILIIITAFLLGIVLSVFLMDKYVIKPIFKGWGETLEQWKKDIDPNILQIRADQDRISRKSEREKILERLPIEAESTKVGIIYHRVYGWNDYRSRVIELLKK